MFYFQVIFEVLFGHKKVKLNDVRKHLRKWNGWDVDPDSQEHHELQEGIGSVSFQSNATLKHLREGQQNITFLERD